MQNVVRVLITTIFNVDYFKYYSTLNLFNTTNCLFVNTKLIVVIYVKALLFNFIIILTET